MRHDLLVQAVDWEIRSHCPNKEQNDNTHRLPFAFFFFFRGDDQQQQQETSSLTNLEDTPGVPIKYAKGG